MERAVLRRSVVVLALGGVAWLIGHSGLPFCPMAGVLGIPCPGCGLTRASLALARGDFTFALTLHPLVFVLAPLFAAAVLSSAWNYVRGPMVRRPHPWLASRAATALASVLLLTTLGVWGARFRGYLGGPVPVVTLRQWWQARQMPNGAANADAAVTR